MSRVLDLWSGMTGTILDFAGITAPSGWAMCYGQAVSRTGNPELYAVLCPVIGTFTVSIASPGVLSKTAHGMSNGLRVRLFTTGALPTGLTANTDYYVVNAAADTWQLSATLGGAAINTSGTQSGTHTVQGFPHGAGDGSTTFNLPDCRGRVHAGKDDMGGTAASRLTITGSGVTGSALGVAGGAETQTLTAGQIPSITSSVSATLSSGNLVQSSGATGSYSAGTGGGTIWQAFADGSTQSLVSPTASGSASSNNTGGGAHSNTQPTIVFNKIIKT